MNCGFWVAFGDGNAVNELHLSSDYWISTATGLLGRAVVKEFERGGWNVIGTGFSRVGQDDGYQGEGRGGGSAQMVRLDLLDEEAMDRVLKEIRYVDWIALMSANSTRKKRVSGR